MDADRVLDTIFDRTGASFNCHADKGAAKQQIKSHIDTTIKGLLGELPSIETEAIELGEYKESDLGKLDKDAETAVAYRAGHNRAASAAREAASASLASVWTRTLTCNTCGYLRRLTEHHECKKGDNNG